jgi:hypothetical protein
LKKREDRRRERDGKKRKEDTSVYGRGKEKRDRWRRKRGECTQNTIEISRGKRDGEGQEVDVHRTHTR